MNKSALSVVLLCIPLFSIAQEQDLLKTLPSDSAKKEFVTGAFKSSRVIMGQSIEMIGKGVLDFRILHRFGEISSGADDFFGLDEATMRLAFDYGLSDNLTLGVGRSTLQKEFDGFIKYRPVRQATGAGASPVAVVLVAGMTLNTFLADSVGFSDRTAYYLQAVIGRKFSNQFTMQVTPTYLRSNTVAANDDRNIFAVGIGGRYKFSNRMAFVVDYFYVTNKPTSEKFHNPLSVGIDIETGGHVFQLHFSNANGMNERAFIAETRSDWGSGDIMFGFNLSRLFHIGRSSSNW
ncbi:MAG TPA: DUF5777 family beta-barrel protein [Flavitalea sp.]|nr:DUF5777 family beta-barrel protein [Flavitalea sp.]